MDVTTADKPFFYGLPQHGWWARQDLNLHPFRDPLLRGTRLPVPPLARSVSVGAIFAAGCRPAHRTATFAPPPFPCNGKSVPRPGNRSLRLR